MDAHGKIYVADRGNRRIQVFDSDGKFLRQITIDVVEHSAREAPLGDSTQVRYGGGTRETSRHQVGLGTAEADHRPQGAVRVHDCWNLRWRMSTARTMFEYV